MSLLRLMTPVLLFVALLGAGTSALAKPPTAGERSHKSQQDDRDRGDEELSDSVRRIERATRSQVLSAERVPFDGRSVNRIKVVDDRGRVRVYMDDPKQPQPTKPPTRGDDD